MIVFALIALGWWLAAPDRFTAGARTASGAGLRAAGTGARAHWNGGRDGRALGRTARRDRWGGRVKGAKPHPILLGLEHGAVIAGKAVKGAGKLGAAAVRPVPGEVRDGWRKGQDRHRARTAGRSVPVALDPPWWRRQQPPLDYPPHTCSRCGRTGADDEVFGSYYAVGDVRLCKSCVQWLDRRYPEGWPDDPAEVTEFGQGKRWPSTTVSPRLDPRTGQPIPAPVPDSEAQDSGTATEDRPGTAPAVTTIPGNRRYEPDPYKTVLTRQPNGNVRAEVFYTGSPEHGDQSIWDDEFLTPEAARIGAADLIQEVQADHGKKAPATVSWVDQTVTAVPPQPLYGTPTDQPSGTGPAATTTPTDTNGAPMPAPTELRTHVAVQDFAQEIARLSESSDFVVVAEKARTVGAQSRAGGFGGEMDLATDSLEETARRFAASVDALREQAAAYGKTSLSVQGS